MRSVAQLEPLFYCLAAIAVAIVGGLVLVWDKPPWWRSHPTARRQIDIDRDRIQDYRIRRRHPEIFTTAMPPEEHLTDAPEGPPT